MALLDGIVRGHRKQCRRRLRALNVRKRIGRVSKPRIRMSALEVHLHVCGIPPFRHDGDGFLVPDLSCRNPSWGPCSFRIQSPDGLEAERFRLGLSFRRLLEVVIEDVGWSPARYAARSSFGPDAH